MSWLDTVQLGDFDAGARLELTCRHCGKVRFVTVGELLARGDFGRLWLSEVEARARCRQRGCGGPMRLAMPHSGETKGFVGGIA
ncbi:MAG: hypothetical protein ABT11_15120 [Novosphingobium sp. SCN 66-18]|nr:MAG: hypothetical protein ABT11_15120 [Novosphingobium sp. SCN 66-18]